MENRWSKTVLPVLILVSGLSSLTAGGDRDATQVNKDTEEVGSALNMTVQLDQESVKVGSYIEASIRIRNDGKAPITIDNDLSFGWNVLVTVYDEANKMVGKRMRVRRVRQLTLANYVQLRQNHVFGVDDFYLAAIEIPGTYRIEVKYGSTLNSESQELLGIKDYADWVYAVPVYVEVYEYATNR